jgi:hypothetical protein
MRDDLTLRLAALAAVAATLPAPLLLTSQQALATPTTQVPRPPHMPQAQQPMPMPMPHPVQVPHQPAPVPQQPRVPGPAPAPQPAPPVHTQPAQPPVHTPPPMQTEPSAPVHTAPPVHTPVTTPPVHTPNQGPVSTPKVTEPSAPGGSPKVTEPTGSPTAGTSAPRHPAGSPEPSHMVGPTHTSALRPGDVGSPTPTPHSTGPNGQQTAVITTGGTTRQVPVVTTPLPIPASREAIEAAKAAPVVQVKADAPPPLPPKVDFNRQVETAVRVNADYDQGALRPRHWDYLDYDQYHRPRFFNPLPQTANFRYFYAGEYRTVVVPAGGSMLLDAAINGVFPFTMVAGEAIAVGSFIGGAFIPPVGWGRPAARRLRALAAGGV